MRFGFVRLGIWRLLLGLVALLGAACGGIYIYRLAAGQGPGWFGWLGVALLVALLGISAVCALLFYMLGASFAELDGGAIRVALGWVVDFGIPLDEVSAVRRGRHRLGEGVGVRYDFNGGLAVVSAGHGIVEVELHHPLRVELRFLPSLGRSSPRSPEGKGGTGPASPFVLWAERVKLSLEEPERFIAEVEKRLEGLGGGACAS